MFEEHSSFVFCTAYFLTRSKTLADDITQETFIKIIKNMSKYDVNKPLKPWIYKITINTTRNMLRKNKWLNFVGITPDTEDKETIEQVVLQTEKEKELIQEIDQLSQKLKEVIVLHFYSELKLKEVAEVLDIPIGTCKSRLNAALNKLRKQIPNDNKNIIEGGI
jgi:RNA polymerase sigma factor (sigma-70 family)